MIKPRLPLAILSLAAASLTAFGLFKPLVDAPVVGAIRFDEHSLGGPSLAYCIISALVIGALLIAAPARVSRCGALISVLAVGFLAGLFHGIHTSSMDQVMQIADLGDGKMDEGIKKVLDQMRYGTGAWCCAAGCLITLVTAALSLCAPGRVASHESSR